MQKGFTLPQLIIAFFVLAGAWGWIWNIVKLVGMGLDPITTGLLIVRVVGIFIFPVGMVVGYIP